MPQSLIYKTLIWNDEVSLAVIDSTALVNEAISRHGLSPVAAAALGRTMTAAAYLCSWLKEDKSELAITLSGQGAGGKLFVAGDGKLRLRGYCEHPEVSLPPRADGKLDVGGFVGREGTLTVVRDDGDGIPYVGTSELVSGEVAEDFSAYFLTSEQRPTALALGVKIGTDGRCLGAGGVFLQPLPNPSEEVLVRTEETIARYGDISSQIADMGAENVLRGLTNELPVPRKIQFRCRCSRAKMADVIRSLGREEAESLLKALGHISVHCAFCNTDYTFGEEETEALFGGKA